ncbi:hypothetical protein [Flavivirga jejuensis]|uniref:DUF4304 domain-containing protein n=1 Tax=Flavivirga jejuensis TaxID=870487 RepID=A0ABT8WNX7_9FLAO|nr:hypothetical protein [Flavivirga jejuensis]MDO5974850.1 hypothetical protein [Flavivirga jejuensis]
MVRLGELERHLDKKVKAFLKPKGFKKKDDEFVVDSMLGGNTVGVIVTHYNTAGNWLNFSATVGANLCDKTYGDFHQQTEGYRNDSYSPLIATLTKLKSVPHPYKDEVMTLDDADQVLENFYLDYEKYIGPFFEKYNSLEAIEQYMNRNFELEGYYLSPIFKAQTGIILAYLVGRKDLGILLEGYISSWRKLTTVERQFQAKTQELKQLKEFLENRSLT